MLRNGADNGRMVRARVDRRDPVDTSGQAVRHSRAKHAVLRSSIQALEERKLGRIRGGGGRERVDLFDDDMRVGNNGALAVQLLRSREVVGLRVHEIARCHVLNCQLNGERGVGLERIEVLGRNEFPAYK